MKSAKNMEFKNKMFEKGDVHKSSLFVGFNSPVSSNLNQYMTKTPKNKDKMYSNNISEFIFHNLIL
jgi:hypothetical protein